jgi:beta-ribofuranosylaminobenzene 5'-phosphate synthase
MSEHSQDGWVHVHAPCRLHFGLLVLPNSAHATHWPDADGRLTVPRRDFGGAGLMIKAPSLELRVRCAATWSSRGPQADRALREAQRLATWMGLANAFEIDVLAAPRPHVGLGSGTQLALGLCRALQAVVGLECEGATELAALTGRGQRSAVGVHGFCRGGFLVDAGQGQPKSLGRLLCRTEFPEEWTVILAVPRCAGGRCGAQETEAFAQLQCSTSGPGHSDAMCRLLVLGLLPALEERNLEAFGAALTDYNRRAGDMYKNIQGGRYSQPVIADMVEYLSHQKVAGCGQSSWGPAVFAVVQQHAAVEVRQALEQKFGLGKNEVVVTVADNDGARVWLGTTKL